MLVRKIKLQYVTKMNNRVNKR